MTHTVEREIAGKKLILETGELAQQASAAVTVKYGDTILLVTVCVSKGPRPGVDFVPLTVDYEERLYAAGRIPGSFFRREGRPTQEATLAARLTDRTLRPLLPETWRKDVQVVSTVLSVDQENPPDVLSIIGASAVLAMSEIPFAGPVSACRIGQNDGQFVVNPTFESLNSGRLSMVVSSTRDMVVMVEAGAREATEETALEAIRLAQEVNNQVIGMIDELVAKVGKPKMAVAQDASADEALPAVRQLVGDRVVSVIEAGHDKAQREGAVDALQAEAVKALAEAHPEAAVVAAFESYLRTVVRKQVLDKGVRPDGRSPTEIRPITCKVGVLPRTHGSGLFTRGQTQVLTIATLASMGMEQRLDTLSPEDTKRYLHHYNFPPYSVGEVGRLGSSGRREIGHGALAERALLVVIPSEEEFPYTIRLVSEVLSSNGSTSMASVCGSTLALMDAGVPIKAPVAGVAMGLVMGEGGQYSVLTDIQGVEDHLGDMDFKVAGTAQGITALQMDIKVKGLTLEILSKALAQARDARLFILDKMKEALTAPRAQLSAYAPKMFRMKIPVEKIGAVIGSGGRTIRSIIEETGATVDVEDDGVVLIGSTDEAAARKAMQRVDNLTRELAIGDIFTGKVTRIASFGAFVELLPGREGLVRSGDLGEAENGLKIGLEMTVMVTEIDSMGRVNCSRRAVTGEASAPGAGRPPMGGRPGGFRPGPGGPPGGGFRGDRGPDR
ncbi:MAG: polyribonucleotide nucleotidyltransferase, partial [Chloroflexota bacterium]|nr:polyribonucleotide nucleotidyltransferase [Chloroflexota bacterium]